MASGERSGRGGPSSSVVGRVRAALAGRPTPCAVPVVRELGYEAGSEFDPGDPFGLCVLTLRPGGAVVLVNRHRGLERRYHATTAPGVLDQVCGHLRQAGFPEIPAHAVPPGPTRRVWLRSAEGEVRTAPMAFHEAGDWPGYRELFRVLDSLVVAVSDGELRVVRDPLPGLLARP